MKHKSIPITVALLLAAASGLHAAVIQTNTFNSVTGAAGIVASSTDLVNAGQATLAAYTESSLAAPTFGANNANDGLVAATTAPGAAGFWRTTALPLTITFTLDISTNTGGYDITRIDSLAGWQAGATQTYANQKFTVEYSVVGSADFTPLAAVDYSPFTSTTSSTAAFTQSTITENSSGILASGVDAIRLVYSTPTVGGGTNAGLVLQEIDVHGYPVGGEPPAPSITVATPKIRQIFQRGAGNNASVPVSGSYPGTPDSIEARMVVMAGGGNSGSNTAWTQIVNAPAGGTFSGMLAGVSAGGWYQLEVRSVSGGVPGDATVVGRIGIGDIYITCGQSNAANYGSPNGNTTDDRVSAWNFSGGAWTKAADPMPGAGGSSGSVWPRLGDLLAARDNVPIAFACVAVGSTSVSQWVPPGGYYPQLKTAVQAFPVNGFRAALWHQGESDSLASTPPATYQSRIQSIIAQSRADAGWTVPWYLAEVGFHPSSNLAQEEPVVAGQLRAIFADARVFPGPVTDDFHLEGKLNGNVHFNAAGLAAHAEQWAEVLGGVPPLAPKNGDFESNTALADGGIAVIDTAALTSPSVIGWRALANSGEAVADGSCGYYNPDDSFYPGASDSSGGVVPNMSGRHVAFLSGSAAGAHFLQTRRAMLAAGHSYTLTAALGVRGNANTFGGAQLELLGNGVVLASRNVTRADLDALHSGNASGTFTDISLTLSTGTAALANQPLAVRIRKTAGVGTYLDFDNVRLVAVVTPFAAWQVDHWGSITQPAAAWNADPDRDFLANVFEYHLGLDPLAPQSTRSFLSALNHDGKNWARYDVPLDPTVAHAGLEMEYSFDLDTWSPAATNPENTVVARKVATSWSLEISTSNHPRSFFRLVGARPE